MFNHMDDITWRNNMRSWDDVDQHIQSLEKLRVKHNKIFEKVVFAQRDDKQVIAQAYASELWKIRAVIDLRQQMFSQMKWGDMY
jgi:hypothetical protein